jgi:ABC-type branched-subunit amino acid transport system ATPase component/ABC-type branched-subunit amino acid transport system permease subunit
MTAAARIGLGVLVLVGILALGHSMPNVFSPYLFLMLCFGVAYALAALPLNLLMGHAGQISLGHAAFLGVGAFAGAITVGRLGLPFLAAILVAAVVGGVIALAIGIPALRIRGMFLALVTLGFGLALSSFVFRIPAVTGGYAGIGMPRPRIGTYMLSANVDLLVLLLIMLAVVWALDRQLLATIAGRAFRALREDERVAASLGVDITGSKLQAFVLYGALTAVAGVGLVTVIGFAQIEVFPFDLSLLFVVIVVAGGLGSRSGVAVVAAAFAIVPRWLSWLHGWELVLGPAVLLHALARHPEGLGSLLGYRQRPRATELDTDDMAGVPSQIELPAGRPDDERGSHGSPLEVVGLTVSFGGLRAVDDLSLAVEPGRITGIIGPNGAGKTTLLEAISGFVAADGGAVLLAGHDITALKPHERAQHGLGRTFQDVGLIPSLSVRENVLLAQHMSAGYGPWTGLLPSRRVRSAERRLRERADEALEALGFMDHADHRLRDLSHGMQRIVELAAVLLSGPSVLLLDEPTAGLSPAAVEALAASLRRLRDEQGPTIIVVEHHLPFVRAICDSVHVLRAGRHLASGSPADVQRDERVVAAYLGSSGDRVSS